MKQWKPETEMTSLIDWFEKNSRSLAQEAANKLAQSETLRETVIEAAEAFYDGLIRSLRLESNLPLNLILLDWVEARSAPTEDEDLTRLLPVLNTLKEVTWHYVVGNVTQSAQAVEWLTELDRVFTNSAEYLVKLETDALLDATRAELNLALTDIERLNKNKSDFIAVAAHELKTPLTLIDGYMNMLRMEFPPDKFPRAELMLSGIGNGTSRLREIIQDMIDVSVIEMDLLELFNQPVWLNRLMEVLESDTGKMLRQRSLTIEFKHDTFPVKPTYGDPERLYQAFSKVLSNAIKYTPDGGSITVHGRELTGFTEIVIADTGIGIDPEDLIRIFEKFSSLGDVALHSSGKTKFKGGGAGLGLSIAKGLIDAHGGTIWAESPEYNERTLPGSIFHVMIPMRNAPATDQMATVFETNPS